MEPKPIPPKIPKKEEPQMQKVENKPKPLEPKEPLDMKIVLAFVFGGISILMLILGNVWGFFKALGLIFGIASAVMAVMTFKKVEKISIMALIVGITSCMLAVYVAGAALFMSLYINITTYSAYNDYYNSYDSYESDYFDYWD